MDKLQEIKNGNLDYLLGGTRYKEQWDWLIEEVERLRVVEKAYEGLKKAIPRVQKRL